jgi:hypothetical protein
MPVLAAWRNGGTAQIVASRSSRLLARNCTQQRKREQRLVVCIPQSMPKRIGGIYAAAAIAITVASACGGTVTTFGTNPVASGGSDTGGASGSAAGGQPVEVGGSFTAGGGEGRPLCEVALGSLGCPATYDAARASVDCAHDSVDSPRFGGCGDLRTFEFGHDGSVTCSYDASSGNLVGGLSCGIPPFYSPACPCVSGGSDPTTSCADPDEPACTAIPLGEAGAGGSSGEGGAAGAAR